MERRAQREAEARAAHAVQQAVAEQKSTGRSWWPWCESPYSCATFSDVTIHDVFQHDCSKTRAYPIHPLCCSSNYFLPPV